MILDVIALKFIVFYINILFTIFDVITLNFK